MKIICLSKRRPQGRDLVERPYGRFYHLPRLLAAAGHDVHLVLLDYQRGDDTDFDRDGMHCMVRSVGAAGPLRYARAVGDLARQKKPDWMVGFSDIYFGLVAERVARRTGCASLIDAYDNYESYAPWFKPWHWLWHGVLERATVISAAGPELGKFMSRRRADDAVVLPMAADPAFKPSAARDTVRKALELPPHARLVGYCGHIHPSRDIDVLFEAVSDMRRRSDDIRLVLCGRLDRRVRLPDDALWLGYLDDEKLPWLIGCLDVLAVVNKDSPFGLHSHPVKLYEAMCCGTPAVATATPATRWILADHPELLTAPGDARDLARGIEAGLERGRVDFGTQAGWKTVALELERVLAEAMRTMP